LLKVIRDFFNWRYVYFVWPLKYLILKPPVRWNRATVILIKVKLCYALLPALVVCISICLKSVLRYKYLILDICIPGTLYRVSQEECARLREGVPYVKVFRYNPKHICPKLNGYGDNDQRSLKL